MENVFYWGNLILSYGVTGYVLLRFLFELFEPKYKKRTYYIVAYLLFVIIAVLLNHLNIPLIKGFYGVIAIPLLGGIMFKTTSKRKIIGAGLFLYLYMVLIDAFSVLIFTLFSGHTIEVTMNNNFYRFITGLINQVMLLCFYRPILAIMQRHKLDTISGQQNVFLIILAVFEIALLNYISTIIDNTINSLILTILSTGYLALDIYLIHLFEAISQKYQLEKEMELRDQQLAMQNNYYNSIETQYDHSRRLIHDMKNHMQTLEEIYVNGDIDEARKYARKIYEVMEKMGSRFKCQNRILTIIINDKILKCDEQGIETKIEVEDLNFDFIEPFDMTTIFSNLLDNAIEACEKVPIEDRKINLRVFSFKQFITISVRNRYNGELIWNRDDLLSTKGGKHMGLGLKNIRSAVEKYDGTMQRKCDDEFFEVKILLSPAI